MPNLYVQELGPTMYSQWDAFIDKSHQGRLFHKSYWLRASGRAFKVYGCFKDGELLAGLPIVYVASRFGLKHGAQPPLTPYLGVVYKDSSSKYVSRISNEKKLGQAIAVRVKKDFDWIQFSFSPSLTDLQPFIWEGFASSVRYTYLVALDDLEKVWQDMDAKRRNDITRAGKDGIWVEISNDFEQTLALVQQTFERQGKKVEFKTEARNYNNVLSEKGLCKSFLARNGRGDPVAAVYIVWDKQRSYYLLGGYDHACRHHGASAIAMWEAIKFTKEELGLCQFDFEGSMIQPVELFFRKFGGRLTPYYSVSWAKRPVKLVIGARRILRKGIRRMGLQ